MRTQKTILCTDSAHKRQQTSNSSILGSISIFNDSRYGRDWIGFPGSFKDFLKDFLIRVPGLVYFYKDNITVCERRKCCIPVQEQRFLFHLELLSSTALHYQNRSPPVILDFFHSVNMCPHILISKNFAFYIHAYLIPIHIFLSPFCSDFYLLRCLGFLLI